MRTIKVPSLARSVPKPLKVPSLARSVPKPLKVPSLARSVPKLLSISARNLLPNRLRGQPSPFSSHVIKSSGVPGESQLVSTDGRMEYFLRPKKPCFFGFSKWYVRPSFLPSIQAGGDAWNPGGHMGKTTISRKMGMAGHATDSVGG